MINRAVRLLPSRRWMKKSEKRDIVKIDRKVHFSSQPSFRNGLYRSILMPYFKTIRRVVYVSGVYRLLVLGNQRFIRPQKASTLKLKETCSAISQHAFTPLVPRPQSCLQFSWDSIHAYDQIKIRENRGLWTVYNWFPPSHYFKMWKKNIRSVYSPT